MSAACCTASRAGQARTLEVPVWGLKVLLEESGFRALGVGAGFSGNFWPSMCTERLASACCLLFLLGA